MIALLAAFALSFLLSVGLEPRPFGLAALRAPWRATALRLLLHLALFSAAFALSWRPWHAAFVVCAVSFLFGEGSAMKRRILGEPVVFSDFALVRNAIRHPRLYYAEKLAEPKALALFAVLAAATAIWFALEPSVMPSLGWPLVVLPFLVTAGAVAALRSGSAGQVARALVDPTPQLDRDVARFGIGGAMVLHWLAWRTQPRPGPAASVEIAARPPVAAAGPAIVVAIQCESFVDLAARGASAPAPEAYRTLALEAVAWGRCAVPAEGAYTMRSEFCFLTGLAPKDLGFDVFDPYLVSDAYAEASAARRLKAAGRATVFMHPYDRRFFDRETLIPDLGFERFVDGRDFEGAARFGPYVSDAAVAEAIEGEIARAARPTFLFAVTIENHGPWGPGRIPGIDDPEAQYVAHLRNADLMIGRVAEALRRTPGGGVLCIYGDHAPARSILPGLPDRGATDYLIWDSRAPAASPTPRKDLEIEAVGRLTFELATTA